MVWGVTASQHWLLEFYIRSMTIQLWIVTRGGQCSLMMKQDDSMQDRGARVWVLPDSTPSSQYCTIWKNPKNMIIFFPINNCRNILLLFMLKSMVPNEHMNAGRFVRVGYAEWRGVGRCSADQSEGSQPGLCFYWLRAVPEECCTPGQ